MMTTTHVLSFYRGKVVSKCEGVQQILLVDIGKNI